MRWLVLTLVSASSFCVAATRCPDPKLRQAAIGGDTIAGFAGSHQMPLKFARVRLYSSSGKVVWIGATGKNGVFTIDKVPPGDYRLEVSGWGRATVELKPDLDRDKNLGGEIPSWWLLLSDNACIATLESAN